MYLFLQFCWCFQIRNTISWCNLKLSSENWIFAAFFPPQNGCGCTFSAACSRNSRNRINFWQEFFSRRFCWKVSCATMAIRCHSILEFLMQNICKKTPSILASDTIFSYLFYNKWPLLRIFLKIEVVPCQLNFCHLILKTMEKISAFDI